MRVVAGAAVRLGEPVVGPDQELGLGQPARIGGEVAQRALLAVGAGRAVRGVVAGHAVDQLGGVDVPGRGERLLALQVEEGVGHALRGDDGALTLGERPGPPGRGRGLEGGRDDDAAPSRRTRARGRPPQFAARGVPMRIDSRRSLPSASSRVGADVQPAAGHVALDAGGGGPRRLVVGVGRDVRRRRGRPRRSSRGSSPRRCGPCCPAASSGREDRVDGVHGLLRRAVPAASASSAARSGHGGSSAASGLDGVARVAEGLPVHARPLAVAVGAGERLLLRGHHVGERPVHLGRARSRTCRCRGSSRPPRRAGRRCPSRRWSSTRPCRRSPAGRGS